AFGAIGLMLCQLHLVNHAETTPAMEEAVREAIRDVFAWFQENFDIRHEPNSSSDREPRWYRWVLGWAADLAHMRYFGDHDVYAEGASRVLEVRAKQAKDGFDLKEDMRDLLFLERSRTNPCSPLAPSARPR